VNDWKLARTAVVASLAMVAIDRPLAQDLHRFPVIRGDYLGESLPGAVPVLFAPGMASTDLHDDWPPIFTPDGNEVLLRVVGPTRDGRVVGALVHAIREGGVWQPPEPLWFSNEFLDVEGFLALSRDGSRLYVSTARAAWTADGDDPDRDIWCFERADSVWSEPTRLDSNINSDLHDLVTSVGTDETLYFDRQPRSGEFFSRTYYAKPDGAGGYHDPVELTDFAGPVRFQKVLIAHDDSYLIMTGARPTGDLDLYVSFGASDGAWGKPINLESVNSVRSDKFPGLSPDGLFLFFASRRTPADQTPGRFWDIPEILSAPKGDQVDVYWVSTEVIERLRPR